MSTFISNAPNSTEIRGNLHYDPAATQKFVKKKIGEVLDKGEEISKKASNTSLSGFVPVVLSGVASVMRFCKLPENVCASIDAYGTQQIVDHCDPLIDGCTKATNRVAKQILDKSADASIGSSFSAYNWLASWF